MTDTQQVDVLIVGSSFTGSLLGWILARHGRRVLVIDRARHPRFAIGESSTPTADFLLAHLADRWQLPELAPMACWGTWKQTYPEVTCGKKRGFSYYRHYPTQRFEDDCANSNSLLVAASCEDYWSDTHWLRSDVDHHFVKQAIKAGADCLEAISLVDAKYDSIDGRWHVGLESGDERLEVQTPWIVDASGVGGALANFTNNGLADDWMRTKTGSIFGHFRDVARFDKQLGISDLEVSQFFSGDDAAQHQVIDDGWLWMLRMDNGVTSVGVVKPTELLPDENAMQNASTRQTWWQSLMDLYPSLGIIMQDSKLIGPEGGLAYSRRLSRCRSQAAGDGWVMMPTAFGFIDPLHSTGIAHGLSGVSRIAEALLGPEKELRNRFATYENDLRQEIRWLDTLVGGCYRGLPNFKCFLAFASFYFAAAIQFERHMAADPQHWPSGYFLTHERGLRDAAEVAYELLVNQSQAWADTHFVDHVRRSLEPWNPVGLLDPALKNRLTHTVAPKYASIARWGVDDNYRNR